MNIFNTLPEDWKFLLKNEFTVDMQNKISDFLYEESKYKTICPETNNIFKAFELCTFNDLKVVILGQDPYHNVGQAHGLSFSVPKGVENPPSLKNILKELSSDLSIEKFSHGCLESWAKQGILLLNSFLTVELHQPLSHSKIGWEVFTDNVIQQISNTKQNVVFILWGSFAKNKIKFIDSNKHFVLTSAHPSPLSSYKFFGCKHFSKTNDFLISKNICPINWQYQ